MTDRKRGTLKRDILVTLALLSVPVIVLVGHNVLNDPQRSIASHVQAMEEAGAAWYGDPSNERARRTFEKHKNELIQLRYLEERTYAVRITTPEAEFMAALGKQSNDLPMCQWTPTHDGRMLYTIWASEKDADSWDEFFRLHEQAGTP
jgi:hypothetical protein